MDPTISVGKRLLEGSSPSSTKRHKTSHEGTNQIQSLLDRLQKILEEKVTEIQLIQEELGRALAHESSSAEWIQREVDERTKEISKLYDSFLGVVSQMGPKFEKDFSLPDELWIKIFWHVAPENFLTLRRVCKKFAHLTDDISLNKHRNLAFARTCLDAISAEKQIPFSDYVTKRKLSIPLKRLGEYLFEFVSTLTSYDVMSFIREALNESREASSTSQPSLKRALVILRDLGVKGLIDKKIEEDSIDEAIELGEAIGVVTAYDVLNKVAIHYAAKGKFREALQTYEQAQKIKQQNADAAEFPCISLMTLFYLEAQKTGAARTWSAHLCPEIDFASDPFKFFEFFEKTILTQSPAEEDYAKWKVQFVEALAFLAKNEIDQGNIEKGNAFFSYAKNFAIKPLEFFNDDQNIIIDPIISLCRLARVWCSFGKEDSSFAAYVEEAEKCIGEAKKHAREVGDWLEIAQAEFAIYTLAPQMTSKADPAYFESFCRAKKLISALVSEDQLSEEDGILTDYLQCQIAIGIEQKTVQSSLKKIKVYFWKGDAWVGLLNILEFEIKQEWIDDARLTAKLMNRRFGYLELAKYYLSKNQIQQAAKCFAKTKDVIYKDTLEMRTRIALALEKEGNVSAAHNLIKSIPDHFKRAAAFLALSVPEYALTNYAFNILDWQPGTIHLAKHLFETESGPD